MIQARKTQSPLDRPKKRKVGVELRALSFVDAVIGIHDRDDFVGDGLHTVIVLIPDHDDGVTSTSPDGRSMNGGHQFLDLLVAENDKRGI